MSDSVPIGEPTGLRRKLRDMPIRQKLTLVVMTTTGLAVVLAGVGLILADFAIFRNSLKNDLSALARITADNTTASLSFDDPAAASETLRALRARTHVVAACVFNADGTPFAQYIRGGTVATCPPPQANEVIVSQNSNLFVSRPIMLNNQRLGTLVVVDDLRESWDRLRVYGVTVSGVLLLSFLIAFLLSARLRSFITTPILELAQVSTRVSQSRDYTLRAQKFSGDELGSLVDTFNEMLASIQSRDEDLRRSNTNLARSNEDLERFAFIASHDLQEPLRMITLYLQLLLRDYPIRFDEKARRYIDTVQNGAKRMRDLLADLLAYAEIGARFDMPAEPVDLNDAVQKAEQNLAVAIAESGAAITVERLPVVVGFESHFVPLFQNLIGNAIKYRSEQAPAIDIKASREGSQLHVSVADNGIGIAPEYHSKIFVAFKRLHGNKISGTGIGLAICQRVVEKYGGRIWVESDVGQGSTFSFTLPVTLVTEKQAINHN